MAENCHRKKISYQHGRELPQEKNFISPWPRTATGKKIHIGMAENCHLKKNHIAMAESCHLKKNHIAMAENCHCILTQPRTQAHFNRNKTPAQAFTPPADEKKMGAIWIFVYYVVYGSGRGRCRDFLVLKWGGGGVLICKYGI